MTDDLNFGAVTRMFAHARELPAEQREPFLSESCGADVQMRALVEALLRVDESPQTFIDSISNMMTPIEVLTQAVAAVAVGEHAGEFEITGLLGVGGMAAVYEGRSVESGQRAAIKIVYTRDPRLLARFEREVDILSKQEHVNIVRYYGRGNVEIDGHPWPFLAMEIFEGRPITEFSGECEEEEAVDLLVEACDAIAHAHEKLVIHRDLTPRNILVDDKGHLKVIDFGIAKDLEDSAHPVTIEGESAGTPGYMSPEQRAGKPVDVRSDVYSLGAVCYHAITGVAPPVDIDIAAANGSRMSRQTAERRILIDQNLEAVIRKAMAHDREDRYPSASALASDLRRHRKGEETEARPFGRVERVFRTLKRRPAFVLTLGTLAGAGIVALAFVIAMWIVAYQLKQPGSVEPINNGVELRSRGGALLHTWKGSITQADFMDEDRAALLVFSNEEQGYEPGLHVFNVESDIEDAEWRASIDTDRVPSHPAHPFMPDDFVANKFAVIDVFSELPGEEIVTVLQHPKYSACCLQIYTVHGELLFQCWHEGNINEIYWMDDAQRLVLSGWNGEVPWPERGASGVDRHPYVVYAIQPQKNVLDTEWLNEQFGGQAAVQPLWYLCVLPAKASDLIDNYGLAAGSGRYHSGSHVDFVLYSRKSRLLWIAFTLDQQGRVVQTVPSDGLRADDDLRDVNFRLDTLPPAIE